MAHLSEHDLIEYLLYELPASHHRPEVSVDVEASDSNGDGASNPHVPHQIDENSPILCQRRLSPTKGSRPHLHSPQDQSCSLADGALGPVENDLSSAFVGLNALEVAAVANAKKFLSQQVVQKVVNNIWSGDIVFWNSLNVYTTKKAQLYNQRYGGSSTDLFSRGFLCLHNSHLIAYMRPELGSRASSRAYFVSTSKADLVS